MAEETGLLEEHIQRRFEELKREELKRVINRYYELTHELLMKAERKTKFGGLTDIVTYGEQRPSCQK